MTKRVFIIHCWGGKPDSRWYPWLKRELEEKGFTGDIPDMPDRDHPKMIPWVDKLNETVGEADEDCYFVGHSIGCITILRYIETLQKGQKVGGAVLVAGFTTTLGYSEFNSFYSNPIDYEKIKSRCMGVVAIHSDNDPFVPINYGDIFKEKLNARVVMEHDMGHFSVDKNVTELPSALEAVLQLATKK